MPKPKEQSCANCAFYINNGCNRYPPSVYINTLNRTATYPKVEADNWCGEWKKQN